MNLSFLDSLEEATRPDVERRAWIDDVHLELVTEKTLDGVVDDCIASGRFGCDLETTGLDNRVFDGRTKDQIVGYCLSPDVKRGYYIPVRHRKGEQHNLPIQRVETAIRRLVSSEAVAIFHHAKFDQEFLQFCDLGLWDEPRQFDDTMILAYLWNARNKQKGLKYLVRTLLGVDMIELDELFPGDHKGAKDFSELDPSWDPCVWYAAADPLFTYRLYEHLHPLVAAPDGDRGRGQEVVYNLEKMCLPATRWMERCRVYIDQDRVTELMQLGQQEYFDSMREIYDFSNESLGRRIEPGWFRLLREKFVADNPDYNINQQIHDCRLEAKRKGFDDLDGKGHYFKTEKGWPERCDVLSREQLGPLFEELQIPDLRKTEKKEQVQTTQAEIARLEEQHGEKYPFLPKIKRLGELQKALGTYLISLRNDVGPDGTLKIDYNQCGTDTGRFTTPSSQNPASDGGTKFPMHGTPATYDKSRPQCLLRARECVKARPGKAMVACDFGGVELRIATILSGEPLWLREFFRCSTCGQTFDRGDGKSTPPAPPAYCPKCGDDRIGDLHTLTGITFFGEDKVGTKEWKQLRNRAKSANFSMAYGGGPSSIVRTIKCDEQEASRHHLAFNRTYSTLKAWWDSVKAFGRAHGYVKTAFGRHYPIPDIQLPTNARGVQKQLAEQYKARVAAGKKATPPDEAAIRRQMDWNRKFRAKAERNATNGPIQGCLHADCRIPTSLGTCRIQDLWELRERGVSRFKVWTGRNWEAACALYSGLKELVVTEFESGQTIRTSPEHLFRVYREGAFGWVRQDELTPDMWVATNSMPVISEGEPVYSYDSTTFDLEGDPVKIPNFPHNRKPFVFKGNSPILWEFLGMVYGDGTIQTDYLLVHVGEAPKHLTTDFSAERLARECAEELNDALEIGAIARKRCRREGDARRPTWQIKVHNKSFRDFCRIVLGVEDQNTWTKRFPRAVWSESYENRNAFLRGYFSADGGINCESVIDVRSVNEGLLRDAHQLLRSVGIRSTLRLASQRVSVKDRRAFRDRVGFLHSYKRDRMAAMTENPYFDQWHLCPPDLVGRVGQCVRESSLWLTLTKDEKSAVYRLMKGSGSKSQCLRFLNRVKGAEVPQSLRDALVYDFERIVDSEHTGEIVEMYDVEVFDDEHAFVADGYVVHNTSADITKLAMALIYKECKKRDWLDKVYMIITIHDELVFEIDLDILAEAVEVFQEIMTRNRTITKMCWSVPLTTDCEIGFDWTVPYDVKDFKYRRVRPDGVQVNEKGEPTKKVWPEEFVKLFGPVYGFAGDAEAPPAPAFKPLPAPPAEAPQKAQEAPAPVEAPSLPERVVEAPERSETPSTPLPAPTLPSAPLERGQVYEYRLRALGVGVADRLARAIVQCHGRGSHPLRVVGPTGEEALWAGAEILVNPIEFETVAGMYGI